MNYFAVDVILLATGAIVLIANLIILGISIKLYTELMKDKNMERRSK